MEYPSKPGIYLLINKINGKVYPGKSINLRKRLNCHKHESNILKFKGNTQQPIVRALQLYGWNNFDIQILEYFDQIDNNELLRIESKYIEFYDATNPLKGYNLCSHSTDCTGLKRTPEQCRRNGLIHKGKKLSLEHIDLLREITKKRTGKNNQFFGKHHTEETKRKIVEQAKQFIKVKQIDKNTGEIIKIWDSMRKAALEFNCDHPSISYSCDNSTELYGFKWERIK